MSDRVAYMSVSSLILLVCREGRTESRGIWHAYVGYVGYRGEEAISGDGQGSRLVPAVTGQVL